MLLQLVQQEDEHCLMLAAASKRLPASETGQRLILKGFDLKVSICTLHCHVGSLVLWNNMGCGEVTHRPFTCLSNDS